jgi:hypothetical protein
MRHTCTRFRLMLCAMLAALAGISMLGEALAQAVPAKQLVRPMDAWPGILFFCEPHWKLGIEPDPCIAITAEAVRLARDGKIPLVVLGGPAAEVKPKAQAAGFDDEKALVIWLAPKATGKKPTRFETVVSINLRGQAQVGKTPDGKTLYRTVFIQGASISGNSGWRRNVAPTGQEMLQGYFGHLLKPR